MKTISNFASGSCTGASRRLLPVLVLRLFLLGQAGCAPSGGSIGGTTTGNPVVADTSASGAVAGAIGGALSTSGSASAQAVQSKAIRFSAPESLFPPDATAHRLAAATSCPTFATPSGSQCSASGSTLWLTFDTCRYPGSSVTLLGTQAFVMSGPSSGASACGTFPNPGASGTLTRQYVTAANSTTPSSMVVGQADGKIFAIDNHTSNLSNFNLDPLPALVNGGYGSSVTFDSGGLRTAATVAHRINRSGDFDHVVYGSFTVSGDAGGLSRSVSGTVKVYHNGLQIIGTSVLQGIVHANTCCLPIEGSIETTFSAGSNVSPKPEAMAIVGLKEKLTFTGCGTATLAGADGLTKNVSLNRCF